MEGPFFLSQELAHYTASNNDTELLNALIQKPADLVSFFEVACEDEPWCEKHTKFLQLLMRWTAKHYYLHELPHFLAKKIFSNIQQHFIFLKPFLYFQPALFYTVRLIVEKESILINSFMFGVASPYFYNLIESGCFNKFCNETVLNRIPLFLFRLLEEHIMNGQINYLWKLEQKEIFDLMALAQSLTMPQLTKECSTILSRYIDKDNIVETLLKAHQNSFFDWKEMCIKFFNELEWGLRIHDENPTDLKMEILDYKQETIDLFDLFASNVTHLAFSGHLSEESFYKEIIIKCQRLIGLDLCNSVRFADQFTSVPQSLLELDLSSCSWLNVNHMREISRYFPNLHILHLGSNLHLNYLTWGELSQFKKLSTLHLPRSNQIKDEDLKLISHSCPNLADLSLEECRNFSDGGLLEIIQHCHQLTHLNLNRCSQITDKILFALASLSSLRSLNLVRCNLLTDKGLIHFIEMSSSLRYLNIKQCDFSTQLLIDIKRRFPLLELI